MDACSALKICKAVFIANLFTGYCVDLAKEVAEFANFEYTIQLVKDNTYGKKLPNNSWNGMIGELLRRVCVNLAYNHSIILDVKVNLVCSSH